MRLFLWTAGIVIGFLSLPAGCAQPQEDPHDREMRELFGKRAPSPNPARENATLEEKIRPLLPTKREDKWLRIPWRTDIMQARADAARQGKPIFMWLMDGDPLGCV